MTLTPRVVVVHRGDRARRAARPPRDPRAGGVLPAHPRSGHRELDERHDAQAAGLRAVGAAVPLDWRQGRVERGDLSRFLFEPEDVVVVVGQDGLVANVAKYLDGQPVVGVDTDPGRNPGVLVRHRA